MVMTEQDFVKQLQSASFRAEFARNNLSSLNKRLDAYNQELDAFVSALKQTHDYDALIASIESAKSAVMQNEFSIRSAQFCFIVDAIFRLVRANPVDFKSVIESIETEFPIKILWDLEVKPDTPERFETAFAAYIKQIFCDTFWQKFFDDGLYLSDSWRIYTEQAYPSQSCISITIPVHVLDSDTPEILEMLRERTEKAASIWASGFVNTYSGDVHKRRALYEALRQEFENFS